MMLSASKLLINNNAFGVDDGGPARRPGLDEKEVDLLYIRPEPVRSLRCALIGQRISVCACLPHFQFCLLAGPAAAAKSKEKAARGTMFIPVRMEHASVRLVGDSRRYTAFSALLDRATQRWIDNKRWVHVRERGREGVMCAFERCARLGGQ